jgi:hypothetical protein
MGTGIAWLQRFAWRRVAATAVDLQFAAAPLVGVALEVFFPGLRMDAAVSPGFNGLLASQVREGPVRRTARPLGMRLPVR